MKQEPRPLEYRNRDYPTRPLTALAGDDGTITLIMGLGMGTDVRITLDHNEARLLGMWIDKAVA